MSNEYSGESVLRGLNPKYKSFNKSCFKTYNTFDATNDLQPGALLEQSYFTLQQLQPSSQATSLQQSA